MSVSAMLGVGAMVLWGIGTGMAFRGILFRGFLLLFISFVLGCLAAMKGNKWWLILPFVLIVEMFRGLMASMAF